MAQILKDHWWIGDDSGASNDNFAAIYGTGTGVKAQTFTAGSSYPIGAITFKAYRYGNPSGNFNIDIYACSSNDPATAKPTGTSLVAFSMAASGISTTPTTGTDYVAILNSTVDAVSGTMYAIVYSCPNGDVSNNIRVRVDDSSPFYPGGSYIPQTATPGVWGTVYTNYEFLFRTWDISAVNYEEGPLVISAEGVTSVASEIYTPLGTAYDEGTLVVSLVATAAMVHDVYVKAPVVWPEVRPGIYNPLTGNETHLQTLIVVGYDFYGNGVIYYG